MHAFHHQNDAPLPSVSATGRIPEAAEKPNVARLQRNAPEFVWIVPVAIDGSFPLLFRWRTK